MKTSGMFSRFSRRQQILGILAVLLLGLVFLIAAPASNRISSGSTWVGAPNGYRAWYEYMQAEGVEIERWQRPLDELLETANSNEATRTDERATLLVVLPHVLAVNRYTVIRELESWFNAGNQAVILSSQKTVTAAPFSSQLASDAGTVTIETRRRLLKRVDDKTATAAQSIDSEPEDSESLGRELEDGEQEGSVLDRPLTIRDFPIEPVLEDDYGSVMWRYQNGAQGTLVESTTPFLAANAYADAPGNFALLADLVRQGGGTLYVDEYVHGYRDKDLVIEEVAGSWIDYLAKTPLLLLVAQAGVLLVVGLVAQNRRFGQPKQIPPVEMNNSAAYIQALAGVLNKANNHDFLVETLTKAEQKTLQRALGLGDTPVSLDTLQTAWQQTTGRSVAELNVLRNAPKRGLQSDSALNAWLQRLQSLHTLERK